MRIVRSFGAVVALLAPAAPAALATLAGCGGSGSGSGGDGGSLDGTVADGQSDALVLKNADASKPDGAKSCDAQCPQGLVCVAGTCQPPQPTCTTNAACEYDSYCRAGACVPFGSPPDAGNDPTCTLTIAPGVFAPTVSCQFPAADGGVPASDPFPGYVDVQATPIVVNFNQVAGTDGGVSGPPSIVVPFTVPVAGNYTENAGVVRVLRGTDCSIEANLGNGAAAVADAGANIAGGGVPDPMRSSTAVAVGDLDGDGVAEVVAYTGDLSVVAFTRKQGVWGPLWTTVHATTDGTTRFTAAVLGGESWSGPSLHDVDNDGLVDVIVEGYVLDGQTGVQKAAPPSDYALYYYNGSTTLSLGSPPVVVDLDANAQVELLNGSNSWVFDPTTKAWVDDPKYPLSNATPTGWTAVADFSPYDGLHQPEVAVAADSTISVFNRDHSVFLGMNAIPVPGGGGGPPTIADFDGDGLPEIGLAAKDFYTVFDPDCQGTPRPGGKCATATTAACDTSVAVMLNGGATTTLGPPVACPSFVLWSRKTQDHSSDVTGSSVFDFQGTGAAQVVYADECFARVYSGANGQVQFSQYHSSCTWLENPVVADVDGDFHADLVVMSNTACGPVGVGIDCGGSVDTNGVDTTFVGEVCQANQDCVSGSCDQGYCRCTTSADCCSAGVDATCVEQGLMCAPPPAGTPGTGSTCRAPHPHGVQGIRVYKDAKNRWVPSRSIWNQHAYSVTNVSESGTVPKTSAWVANWVTPKLNNYRENVPGNPDVKGAPDLTAQAGPNFTCAAGTAVFEAPVCNRGTAPVGAGVQVGFYSGAGDAGTLVCSAATTTPLAVGQCEAVSCQWTAPPTSATSAVNVTVVANDGGGTPVCDTTNNVGLVEGVFCSTGPK
jgi:hypothetical protein